MIDLIRICLSRNHIVNAFAAENIGHQTIISYISILSLVRL